MRYQVEIPKRVEKVIRKLPSVLQMRIRRRLHELRDNPRAGDVKKMQGVENRYRTRVGSYRIIYEIHDDRLWVLIIEVGDRRDIYRGGQR